MPHVRARRISDLQRAVSLYAGRPVAATLRFPDGFEVPMRGIRFLGLVTPRDVTALVIFPARLETGIAVDSRTLVFVESSFNEDDEEWTFANAEGRTLRVEPLLPVTPDDAALVANFRRDDALLAAAVREAERLARSTGGELLTAASA